MRLGIDDPGGTPRDGFGSYKLEIEGIGYLPDKLSIVLAFLERFLFPFPAVRFRFIPVLFDDLLNFFLFFGRLFGVKRLVILLDQAFDLLAIDFQNLVRLNLRGLDLAF